MWQLSSLKTSACTLSSDFYILVSETIKKAECRIHAFELSCWRRLLRVPWTARRSNQSLLKEISPGCSLEGLMLKLKLQYFGHLMQKADWFEKTLMLGKIEGRRRRRRQRMRWLDGITDSMDVGLGGLRGVGDGQGGLSCCGSWGCKESDMTEWMNWTELNWTETSETEGRENSNCWSISIQLDRNSKNHASLGKRLCKFQWHLNKGEKIDKVARYIRNIPPASLTKVVNIYS